MKIAQIAPLWETTPPKTYGGTELVVYNLVHELAELGHQVTLFATGDSIIPHENVELVAMQPVPLREQGITMGQEYGVFAENAMIAEVLKRAGEFDVIHNHLGHQLVPFADLIQTPVVTTLHGAFRCEHFCGFAKQYAHHPLISISYYQRTLCPDLNYVGNVYHGLELEKYKPNEQAPVKGAESYLAFLGRFSKEKGPAEAIRIARETGYKLIMAGKVNDWEQDYFDAEIAPHIDGDRIRYIGEVQHEQKIELLANAAATLCPISWPEPFGLVFAESMACATPVIALRNGSIPELISQHISGFYGDTVEELIEAVRHLEQFDRIAVRRHAEHQFSRRRMIENYLDVYRALSVSRPERHLAPSPARAEERAFAFAAQPIKSAHADHPAAFRHETKKVPQMVADTLKQDLKFKDDFAKIAAKKIPSIRLSVLDDMLTGNS